jgi:hypothetical protein
MLATAAFALGLLAAPAAVPAVAPADAGLRFETKDGTLYVRRRKVRAALDVGDAHPDMYPDLALGVGAKADGTAWTLTVDTNCQGEKTLRFSAASLEARLASAAASALARRKQWDTAAAGFARAVAFDASYAKAATDLAVAQLRGGHRPEAIATLVAAAARDRVWVVARVAIDRQLAPIAAAPELRALAARTPGHATLAKLRKMGVAFSADGGLVAWDRILGNAMSEDPEPQELRVVDVATGRLMARLPCRDHDAKGVDRALADLGFEVEKVPSRPLAIRTGGQQPDLLGRVEGIRVVVKDGRVSLSADGRPVGESRVGSPFTSGWAAKVRGGVLVGAAVNIGDGCGAWVYDDIVWIPLPPAAR